MTGSTLAERVEAVRLKLTDIEFNSVVQYARDEIAPVVYNQGLIDARRTTVQPDGCHSAGRRRRARADVRERVRTLRMTPTKTERREVVGQLDRRRAG